MCVQHLIEAFIIIHWCALPCERGLYLLWIHFFHLWWNSSFQRIHECATGNVPLAKIEQHYNNCSTASLSLARCSLLGECKESLINCIIYIYIYIAWQLPVLIPATLLSLYLFLKLRSIQNAVSNLKATYCAVITCGNPVLYTQGIVICYTWNACLFCVFRS